ncbi:hypothetical protein SO802_011907, partial [Lithocarpus litseifolius]
MSKLISTNLGAVAKRITALRSSQPPIAIEAGAFSLLILYIISWRRLWEVQHIQSMAAAIAELTRQNQELTREINERRQRYEGFVEGQAQSQEDRGNPGPKSQSRGTTSRRVPHLEKEMDQMRKAMDEMRENMRIANP